MREASTNIVKKWLVEEEVFKEVVADDAADWHYLVELPPGSENFADVIKLKNSDHILVLSGVLVSEEHQKALDSLSPKERSNFLHGLYTDILLHRKAGVETLPDPEHPQRFNFTALLFAKDLTKTALFDALDEVSRSATYVIWAFNHRFRDLQMLKGRGGGEVMFV